MPSPRGDSPVLAQGLSLIFRKGAAGFSYMQNSSLRPHSDQVKQALSHVPDDASQVQRGSGTWP